MTGSHLNSGFPTFANSSRRFIVVGFLIACLAPTASSQQRPPIIDMHMHAQPIAYYGSPPVAVCTPYDFWPSRESVLSPLAYRLKNPPCEDPVWSPKTDEAVMTESIAAMERYNIYGVLSARSEHVAAWTEEAPERFLPALTLAPTSKRFAYSVEDVQELHAQGRLAVLGEVLTAYVGIEPDDPIMEPYWELMEELDVPVGIHIGPGPPGPFHEGYKIRARMHSALTLEEVLVKHPSLRVYIMHAGFPMLDDLLALLYAHPQVYVEVGYIVWGQPRAAFYRYLQGIVEAGFGNRVMFGSDQIVWPGVIERSIASIDDAPFLSAEQKRDIFYNNAARFLRLSEEQIAAHHGR